MPRGPDQPERSGFFQRFVIGNRTNLRTEPINDREQTQIDRFYSIGFVIAGDIGAFEAVELTSGRDQEIFAAGLQSRFLGRLYATHPEKFNPIYDLMREYREHGYNKPVPQNMYEDAVIKAGVSLADTIFVSVSYPQVFCNSVVAFVRPPDEEPTSSPFTPTSILRQELPNHFAGLKQRIAFAAQYQRGKNGVTATSFRTGE